MSVSRKADPTHWQCGDMKMEVQNGHTEVRFTYPNGDYAPLGHLRPEQALEMAEWLLKVLKSPT